MRGVGDNSVQLCGQVWMVGLCYIAAAIALDWRHQRCKGFRPNARWRSAGAMGPAHHHTYNTLKSTVPPQAHRLDQRLVIDGNPDGERSGAAAAIHAAGTDGGSICDGPRSAALYTAALKNPRASSEQARAGHPHSK